MAVVSKQKIFVDASLREFLREVKYSKGKFSCELPEKVVSHLMLDTKSVVANTEASCINIWDDKIIEYNNAKRQVEQVILFRIKLNGFVPMEGFSQISVADQNKDKFRLYEKEIEFFDSKGLGMFIEWGVYSKEFYKEQKRYTRLTYLDNKKEPTGTGFKDSIDSNLKKGIKEIPYTKEREMWFTNLQASFEELLIKVKEKLHSLTSDELLMLVDSNTFKLLSN